MTFKSQKTEYTIISTLFKGEVNDCYVARPAGSGDGREFTIIAIHDHETVRKLMEIESRMNTQAQYTDAFTVGGSFVRVFPYRQERPLSRFFVGEAYTLARCEDICTNLILTCISSGLPFPVLFLILEQGLVNLAKDDSIFLSYGIDLKDLDPKKTERDCAGKSADIMLSVLETKSDVKNISYELLSKKSANNSYSRFTEIYRDLRIAAAPVKKRGIIVRIKSFFSRNKDRIFGILFWLSLILAIVALVLLFTHLVWGDIPFLRIFFNSFKNIGTESLTQ